MDTTTPPTIKDVLRLLVDFYTSKRDEMAFVEEAIRTGKKEELIGTPHEHFVNLDKNYPELADQMLTTTLTSQIVAMDSILGDLRFLLDFEKETPNAFGFFGKPSK